MIEGHSSRMPSLLATMSWAWQGPGGMFCRTESWEASQSALCSSVSLWWEVALANQKGCSVCRPRTRRPSWSHFRGIWLTAFAAPQGRPWSVPGRRASGGEV